MDELAKRIIELYESSQLTKAIHYKAVIPYVLDPSDKCTLCTFDEALEIIEEYKRRNK